ncbi:MAG: beta-ketoacyl synthase N-terminal-like domain-containing protein [Victivallaceae bacterium]|jgi:hypothetical protein
MIQINGLGFCSSSGSMMREPASAAGVNLPVNNLPEDGLKKQLRGCGAFVTAGVRAAMQAMHDSGITGENLATTGIIVTSRLGDQNTTSEFIDDLIDYGIDQGSPLKFAHSNHNAAASYIAKLFNIYGPAVTAVNFEASFANGLILAQCWIEQGTCNNVLLLQIESCSLLSEVLVNYEKGCMTLPADTTAFADSKAPCAAACLLLGNHELNTNNSMRILLSSSAEISYAPEEIPFETPLPDPARLITAVLKILPRQLVTIAGATYLIEKINQEIK